MILWLKYHGHPFDTSVACRRDNSLWCKVQPGDFELWKIGKNSRWIITQDSLDKYGVGDFVLPKSREGLKIWLDINHLRLGKRLGFSECVYQIDEEMGSKFWEYLWVGYDLIDKISRK